MPQKDEWYHDHKLWRDGTIQELIPEPGEDINDAAAFMKSKLKFYGHKNLTFFKNEIRVKDDKFYVILRAIDPGRNPLFKRPTIDKFSEK